MYFFANLKSSFVKLSKEDNGSKNWQISNSYGYEPNMMYYKEYIPLI